MIEARTPSRLEPVVLGLLLLLYIGLSIGYAVNTPKWNNPDEPAHYNYIKEIAEHARLPVLMPGDYCAQCLEQLKAARFPDSMSIDAVRYESHQPPLYYFLASGVYKLAPLGEDPASVNMRVFMLRMFSVACGAILLIVAYRVVALIFSSPETAALRLGVPAFIALLPMHVAMSAAIENDILAELVLSVLLLVLVARMAGEITPGQGELWAGLLWGLALLTKTTIVLPAIVAIVIAVLWVHGGRLAQVLLSGVRIALVGLVISGWWMIRNVGLYGWPDLFGLQRQALVAGEQQQTQNLLAQWSSWSQTTFQSFWGQFGWMGIVAEPRYYSIARWLCIIALVGLVYGLVRLLFKPSLLSRFQYICLVLMAAVLVAVAGGFVYYNLTFYQAQGRYLYPAIIPLGLAFAGGYRLLFGLAGDLAIRLRASRFPRIGAQLAAMAMLYLGFVVLNLWLLARLIAPYFR